MYFQSYLFICLFLPLLLLLYAAVPRIAASDDSVFRLRRDLLLVASILFYLPFGLYNFIVLAVCTVVTFSCYRTGKATLLKVGIVLQVAALFVFKYGGVLFPVAVSFYTFTQIAFLSDALRQQLPKEGVSFPDYLLHVLFFPKLLQGPILRYQETKEMILSRLHTGITVQGFAQGLTLFTFGLAKKVLLADLLNRAVQMGYQGITDLTKPDAVIVILVYPLQLYFDFSGYCDMGRGIARMLSLDLPVNFDAPYRVQSVTEYWRKWHMSLMRFFRDEVYIPLGGNRKGEVRRIVNLVIVFFLSGLWHASGRKTLPAYLVWAAWQVLFIVAEHATVKVRIIPALHTACTYVCLSIGFVFFRAGSLRDAWLMLTQPFRALPTFVSPAMGETFYMDELWYPVKLTPLQYASFAPYICMIIVLAVSFGIVFFAPKADALALHMRGKVPALFTGLLLAWCVLSLGEVQTFLYVNF